MGASPAEKGVPRHPVAAAGEERASVRRTAGMSLNDQWRRVRARLQAELGEATFNSWFKQIDLIGVGDGRVMLSVPTRFIRNWIVSHYADRLTKLWADEDEGFARVDILVAAGEPKPESVPESIEEPSRGVRPALGALASKVRLPRAPYRRASRMRASARRSIRASPSTHSSSASRTSLRMPRPAALPKRRMSASIRSFSMVASASARRI